MMKSLLGLAALGLIALVHTVPASAATEDELRTQCAASGGTLDTTTSPWDCKHPGPASTAPIGSAAPAMINTFDFEGKTWTVIDGPLEAVSAVHMTPGAANSCPSLKVKFETTDKGPVMTAAQKFRGDKQWHVVCVWQ